MGYYKAGFDVVGVDINPQPRYPFKFIQADAMTFDLSGFDVIHASPPCQRYSHMSSCRPGLDAGYPDLIAALRQRLEDIPYVIENVEGAPLRDAVMLCGQMFGLELYRHRWFESNQFLIAPDHPVHIVPASKAGHWREGTIMSVAGHVAPVSKARHIMGIDWMTRDELTESIPPVYTQFVGAQLNVWR